MQLYFIRHAQSTNNHLWEQTKTSNGRSMDPELTEKGWRQARQLAKHLAKYQLPRLNETNNTQNKFGYGLTHLYTSLMVRAVATGCQVARALNMPLRGWVDLHEEGGIYMSDPDSGGRLGYPGKNQAYFAEHYPELLLEDGLARDGWWNRPYEAQEEVPTRVRRFYNELIDKHGDTNDRVAVFSHGGFFNAFMHHILGVPSSTENTWFVMNNTAITRIDFNAGEIIVAYMNRVDFLPADMIT